MLVWVLGGLMVGGRGLCGWIEGMYMSGGEEGEEGKRRERTEKERVREGRREQERANIEMEMGMGMLIVERD